MAKKSVQKQILKQLNMFCAHINHMQQQKEKKAMKLLSVMKQRTLVFELCLLLLFIVLIYLIQCCCLLKFAHNYLRHETVFNFISQLSRNSHYCRLSKLSVLSVKHQKRNIIQRTPYKIPQKEVKGTRIISLTDVSASLTAFSS